MFLFQERMRLKRQSLLGTTAERIWKDPLCTGDVACRLPWKDSSPRLSTMAWNKHITVIHVCAAGSRVPGKGFNDQSAFIWQAQGNTIFSNFGYMGWVLLSMSTPLVGFSPPFLPTLMVGPASFLPPELSMLPCCAITWSHQQIFTTACKGSRRKGFEVESKHQSWRDVPLFHLEIGFWSLKENERKNNGVKKFISLALEAFVWKMFWCGILVGLSWTFTLDITDLGW